jgi:PAS domain S-box-containing protein
VSIRYKISFLLGIALVGIIFLNVALALGFILPSFKRIEIIKAETNMERVLEAYNNKFENINSKVSDWACWDDAYDFVGGSNNGFVENNITNTVFKNLKVNFMIYVNSAGETVYEGSYDIEKDQPLEDFTGWADYLKNNDLLTDYDENKSKMGLIFFSGKPLLFGAHPVLDSDAQGPSHGTLIFVRHLSENEIQNLSALTKLDLKIEPVGQVSDQTDRAALDFLTTTGEYLHTIEIDSNTLREYSLIKDFYNQPALLIKANLQRDVYNQGLQAVKYLIINLSIGSIFALLLASLLLEFLVLRRIFKFNSGISQITKSRDLSEKILVGGGNDEISSMTASTNLMLDALKQALYSFETERQKLQAYVSVMEIMLVALDKNGNVAFVNQKAKDILGVIDDGEIIGKNWFDNFVPEKNRKQVKEIFEKIILGKEMTLAYFENPVKTKKGDEKTIAWHNALLRDGSGNVLGTVSSGEDITKKKEQERIEKERADDLKKANELMIGREMRIIELKKEIEEIKKEAEEKNK